MLILVGPSASGKTEVAQILINDYGMERMVTYTTRPIRYGEVNHVSYHFVSKEEFIQMKENNEFVETVLYNDNYYGTKKSDVTEGKIVILEPSGLKVFKEKMPKEVMSFYLVTDETTRFNRMIYRKDSIENARKRIQNDKEAFDNIVGVDHYIDNEDITLDELTEQINKTFER